MPISFSSGDIICAVIEIGSRWIKAGFSGDDSPMIVIPSSFGLSNNTEKMNIDGTESSHSTFNLTPSFPYASGSIHGIIKINSNLTHRYHIGDLQLNTLRSGLVVKQFHSPMVNTEMQNAFIALFYYIFYIGALGVTPEETPVLITFCPSFQHELRETAYGVLLNFFNIPAIYSVNSAILTAFSQGKGSALIVNMGHEAVSINPVIDGFVLHNCSFQDQRFGGQMLTQKLKEILTNDMGIKITIPQQIISKEKVELMSPAKARTRPLDEYDSSLLEFLFQSVIEDAKISIAHVSDLPHFDPLELGLRPASYYEFPNGYTHSFLAERFKLVEDLFRECGDLDKPSDYSLPELVQKCIMKCDIELRSLLCSHIIVVGGTSLVPGFIDRLSTELIRLMPTQKIKIASPSSSYERRFAPWIGGSILASLSAFHKLWIMKKEVDRHGLSIIEKTSNLNSNIS